MKFTKEMMRERFKAARAERDAILAKSMPLREARDAFVNEAREKEAAMNAEIKAAEEGLFDLQNEIGALARALGGKTG